MVMQQAGESGQRGPGPLPRKILDAALGPRKLETASILSRKQVEKCAGLEIVEGVYGAQAAPASSMRTNVERSSEGRPHALSSWRPAGDCIEEKLNDASGSLSITNWTQRLQKLQTPSNRMTERPLGSWKLAGMSPAAGPTRPRAQPPVAPIRTIAVARMEGSRRSEEAEAWGAAGGGTGFPERAPRVYLWSSRAGGGDEVWCAYVRIAPHTGMWGHTCW